MWMEHPLRAGGPGGDLDVPQVEQADELLDDPQVLPTLVGGELVGERHHQRLDERAHVVEAAARLQAVEHGAPARARWRRRGAR